MECGKVGSPVAPSRVRGLKLLVASVFDAKSRRTLTGAWIETMKSLKDASCVCVAPSRVRGLKRYFYCCPCNWQIVAPSRVRGLKLENGYVEESQVVSHPHGCVD